MYHNWECWEGADEARESNTHPGYIWPHPWNRQGFSVFFCTLVLNKELLYVICEKSYFVFPLCKNIKDFTGICDQIRLFSAKHR